MSRSAIHRALEQEDMCFEIARHLVEDTPEDGSEGDEEELGARWGSGAGHKGSVLYRAAACMAATSSGNAEAWRKILWRSACLEMLIGPEYYGQAIPAPLCASAVSDNAVVRASYDTEHRVRSVAPYIAYLHVTRFAPSPRIRLHRYTAIGYIADAHSLVVRSLSEASHRLSALRTVHIEDVDASVFRFLPGVLELRHVDEIYLNLSGHIRGARSRAREAIDLLGELHVAARDVCVVVPKVGDDDLRRQELEHAVAKLVAGAANLRSFAVFNSRLGQYASSPTLVGLHLEMGLPGRPLWTGLERLTVSIDAGTLPSFCGGVGGAPNLGALTVFWEWDKPMSARVRPPSEADMLAVTTAIGESALQLERLQLSFDETWRAWDMATASRPALPALMTILEPLRCLPVRECSISYGAPMDEGTLRWLSCCWPYLRTLHLWTSGFQNSLSGTDIELHHLYELLSGVSALTDLALEVDFAKVDWTHGWAPLQHALQRLYVPRLAEKETRYEGTEVPDFLRRLSPDLATIHILSTWAQPWLTGERTPVPKWLKTFDMPIPLVGEEVARHGWRPPMGWTQSASDGWCTPEPDFGQDILPNDVV